MPEQPDYDAIIKQLQEKYKNIDQDTDDHLMGLLYSKTYYLLGLYTDRRFIKSANSKNYFK